MTLQLPEQKITSGSDSPWTSPIAWDSITIGGVSYGPITQVGGKVRIRGAGIHYRLDTKDPKGANGSVTTFRGESVRTAFSIEFIMWTQLQYDYFEQYVIPAITYYEYKTSFVFHANMPEMPDPGKAISIAHPSLQSRNITAIQIEHIGATVPDRDGPETFRCVVTAKKYLPPPPSNVTSTPNGTRSTNAATTPGNTPANADVARNQAQIARLQAQNNALP